MHRLISLYGYGAGIIMLINHVVSGYVLISHNTKEFKRGTYLIIEDWAQ